MAQFQQAEKSLSQEDDFCEVSGEPIVGYDTKNKRFVCNSCIFNGSNCGKQKYGGQII